LRVFSDRRRKLFAEENAKMESILSTNLVSIPLRPNCLRSSRLLGLRLSCQWSNEERRFKSGAQTTFPETGR
jgi:hypothetical protein